MTAATLGYLSHERDTHRSNPQDRLIPLARARLAVAWPAGAAAVDAAEARWEQVAASFRPAPRAAKEEPSRFTLGGGKAQEEEEDEAAVLAQWMQAIEVKDEVKSSSS
ncbi:hypothetical protein H9P43_009243 [Blastocladiella emersonii ATCC 22665]|nr:hypothetical protein H9P43_009243 [Blastocladiella emersonii ATCC 22665]